MVNILNKKTTVLKQYLKSLKSVAVAFSSGVDSTFLLKTAKNVLGDNVIAITAQSVFFPKRELQDAVDFCEKENIKHIVFEFDGLQIEGLKENPVNRCYLCKKVILKEIIKIAQEHNIQNVVEGSNADDNNDYRPGAIAVQELDVKSPLKFAGLTKKEIRLLSQKMNLPTFDKPSFACLASRFAYEEEITHEKIRMVDESEQFLLNLGVKQFRVRVHGKIARIEVLPEDFDIIFKNRDSINAELKKYGFSYVTIDLQGYRTGRMNETLKK